MLIEFVSADRLGTASQHAMQYRRKSINARKSPVCVVKSGSLSKLRGIPLWAISCQSGNQTLSHLLISCPPPPQPDLLFIFYDNRPIMAQAVIPTFKLVLGE